MGPLPGPWPAVVILLGTYRLVRLIGWDDLPPILRLRERLTGPTSRVTGSQNSRAGLTSEEPVIVWSFRRPLLAHFLGCAFCQGFWVSLAAYGAWLAWPHYTLYALAPFALSGAVGLIARNLDP